MTIPQGLRLAKRSGFDFIGVCISEAGYLTLESDGSAVEFLRQAVTNMSLDVVAAEAQILRDFPPNQEWLAAAEACIRICEQLGCPTIIVDIPSEECDSYLSLILDLKDRLYETSICFALRIGNCSAPASIDSVRSLIESIDSGRVGICLDTACPMVGLSPNDCASNLVHHIKIVVARDYRRCDCGDVRLVNPMQGDMDWVSFRQSIIKNGYSLAILAEAPGYPQYPELGVQHLGDQMKRIFRAPSNHNE